MCYICKLEQSAHSVSIDEYIRGVVDKKSSVVDAEQVNFYRTMSLKLIEKIRRDSEKKGEIKPDDEEEYCPVCYENPIKEGAEGTHKFTCGHSFCCDCAREQLKLKVESNQLDQLICPQALCG